MLYLTKEQISEFVDRIGQPRASILLNGFFNRYRKCLKSSDVAPLYDATYRERIAGIAAAVVVADRFKVNIFNVPSFNYLRPRMNPSTRVLDVGCGDGDFTMAVAASGAGWVLGVDFAAEQIEAATARARDAGLTNCVFECKDVAALGESEQFDFVVLNDVTEHISDDELDALLRSIAALSRSSTQLVIHTPNGLGLGNGTSHNWFTLLYRGYARLRSGFVGLERGVEQLYYDQLHINIKSFPELRRALSRWGFRATVSYDTNARYPKSMLTDNMLVVAIYDSSRMARVRPASDKLRP